MARAAGYDLKQYKMPTAKLDAAKQRWEVLFEHVQPKPPGADFAVWIDNRTGKARLMRGE